MDKNDKAEFYIEVNAVDVTEEDYNRMACQLLSSRKDSGLQFFPIKSHELIIDIEEGY